MKYVKLFNELVDMVQNRPDIHLPTFKLVLNTLFSFFSKTNQDKFKREISILKQFTTIQQTIDENISMNNIKKLSKELNRLKKDD